MPTRDGIVNGVATVTFSYTSHYRDPRFFGDKATDVPPPTPGDPFVGPVGVPRDIIGVFQFFVLSPLVFLPSCLGAWLLYNGVFYALGKRIGYPAELLGGGRKHRGDLWDLGEYDETGLDLRVVQQQL